MVQETKKTILFVYNADSGLASSLIDYGKKYVTPSKYDCQLCMVSYGPFGMKKNWKAFVDSLPYPVTFLHKNEFVVKYPKSIVALPAMLIVNEDRLDTLIDSRDFEAIRSLDELKSKVSTALKNYKT